jgi:MFS family permease
LTSAAAKSGAEGHASGLLSRAFVALCLICFLNSFLVAPFSSLFPVYVEADLERLPWFTGSLRGLMLVLGGIFAVVGGRLCDLLGRKVTLLIGLCGAIVTGMIFRTSSPLLLTALIIGMGIGTGPWSTAGQSYLISSVSARRLGLGGALYFLTNTAGGALGSLVTGLAHSGWELPQIGLAMTGWEFPQIGLAMTVAMVAVLGLAVVIMPGGQNGRVPRQAGDRPRLALWATYRPFLSRRDVQLLIGLRYMVTSFWGMAVLLMPLLVYRVSQSESMPAYYASVSLSVAAGCQLLTGVLADRYGRTGPLLIAATGIVISAAGLALFWESLPGLFVLGTALTGTAWAVSTLIPKLINDVALPEERSRLVGLGHLVWSAAMLTGSIVGGLLVEITPALPFAAGAVLACGGTLCAWRLCVRLELSGR